MKNHNRYFWMFTVFALIALTALGLSTQKSLAASFWYVSPDGDDASDCLTPLTPCATINSAIEKASPGDTVYLAVGTYQDSGNEVVLVNKNINLSGGWSESFSKQGDISTVDAQNTRRGVVVNSGITANIQRLLIRNGHVDCCGYVGAGIMNSGNLTLSHSIVSENITQVNSPGGGIYNGGSMAIIDTNIRNNVTFGNSIGGGIYNQGDLSINNSTVNNNQSILESGGGIYNTGTLSLNNTTIYGNIAAYYGGGIYNSGVVNSQNTIIANNISSLGGSDCSGPILSNGYNLIGLTAGCTFTPSTGDLMDINPKVGILIGSPGYIPLLPDSPAVNAGSPSTPGSGGDACTAVDQRGAARNGRCDIGAYEYTVPGAKSAVWAVSGTPQRTAPSTAFWFPLELVVVDGIGSPVPNIPVKFNAPADGASGRFYESQTYTDTVMTDMGGSATTDFIANDIPGDYLIIANVEGIITPTAFSMSNTGWYVSSSSGNDANNCQSPASACASLNGVLGKITDYDTILVTGEVYTGTGDQVLLINKNVRMLGGWDATFTQVEGFSIIDGEDARQGIRVDWNVTAEIDLLMVENGFSNSGLSGGIVNGGGNLTLNGCILTDNTAYDGGGIYNYGFMTINYCLVMNNTANNGAAASGIQSGANQIEINHTSISFNTGGGIGGGSIHLNQSSVNNNPGTGIYISGGENEITNSTVSNNGGLNFGPTGGVHVDKGTLYINSSTISKNYSLWFGGGITTHQGTVTMKNTILAGNLGSTYPDCNGSIISNGYNLIGDTTNCGFNPTKTDLLDTPAYLLPLQGFPEYHPLWIYSPAIDAGNPAGCTDQQGTLLVNDQREGARVLDGNGDGIAICDIGAYELNRQDIYPVHLPIVSK